MRSPEELLEWLFRYDAQSARDLIFARLPQSERGPVLTAWGIRGAKAALRDNDEKVREVVHDALIAGDLDAPSFEEGIGARMLIRWVPLSEWWSFWRAGKLTNPIVQKALSLARERGLFDDAWLLGALTARSGRLQGTDAISDWLTKDALVGWIRALAASKDASPKGVVAALGWDVLLAKAPADSLLGLLDALAKHLALLPASILPAPAEEPAKGDASAADAGTNNAATTSVPESTDPADDAAASSAAAPPAPATEAKPAEPTGAVSEPEPAEPTDAAPAAAVTGASPSDDDPNTETHAMVAESEDAAPAPRVPTAAPPLPGVLVSASAAPAPPAPPLPGVPVSAAAAAPVPSPPAAADDLSAFDDIEVMPDSVDGATAQAHARDTGLPIALPDNPAVEAGDEEWSGEEPAESDKLLQARTAVMASLGAIDRQPNDASYTDASSRPSALTWGESAPRNTPTPTDEITLGQGPKPRSNPDEPRTQAADGASQKAARLKPVPPRIPRPSK